MKKLTLTGLLLATFLTYSCESPERTDQAERTEQQEPSGLSDSEKDFVQEMAKRNLYDLEIATLAKERATTEEVKEYANTLVSEKENINQQLRQLAQQKNVFLADSLDQDQRDKINELAQKEGFEFDEEFIDEMVDRQKENLDRFESKAEDAEDQELKNWAQETLPTYRQHVERAESVEATVEERKEAQKAG